MLRRRKVKTRKRTVTDNKYDRIMSIAKKMNLETRKKTSRLDSKRNIVEITRKKVQESARDKDMLQEEVVKSEVLLEKQRRLHNMSEKHSKSLKEKEIELTNLVTRLASQNSYANKRLTHFKNSVLQPEETFLKKLRIHHSDATHELHSKKKNVTELRLKKDQMSQEMKKLSVEICKFEEHRQSLLQDNTSIKNQISLLMKDEDSNVEELDKLNETMRNNEVKDDLIRKEISSLITRNENITDVIERVSLKLKIAKELLIEKEKLLKVGPLSLKKNENFLGDINTILLPFISRLKNDLEMTSTAEKLTKQISDLTSLCTKISTIRKRVFEYRKKRDQAIERSQKVEKDLHGIKTELTRESDKLTQKTVEFNKLKSNEITLNESEKKLRELLHVTAEKHALTRAKINALREDENKLNLKFKEERNKADETLAFVTPLLGESSEASKTLQNDIEEIRDEIGNVRKCVKEVEAKIEKTKYDLQLKEDYESKKEEELLLSKRNEAKRVLDALKVKTKHGKVKLEQKERESKEMMEMIKDIGLEGFPEEKKKKFEIWKNEKQRVYDEEIEKKRKEIEVLRKKVEEKKSVKVTVKVNESTVEKKKKRDNNDDALSEIALDVFDDEFDLFGDF